MSWTSGGHQLATPESVQRARQRVRALEAKGLSRREIARRAGCARSLGDEALRPFSCRQPPNRRGDPGRQARLNQPKTSRPQVAQVAAVARERMRDITGVRGQVSTVV